MVTTVVESVQGVSSGGGGLVEIKSVQTQKVKTGIYLHLRAGLSRGRGHGDFRGWGRVRSDRDLRWWGRSGLWWRGDIRCSWLSGLSGRVGARSGSLRNLRRRGRVRSHRDLRRRSGSLRRRGRVGCDGNLRWRGRSSLWGRGNIRCSWLSGLSGRVSARSGSLRNLRRRGRVRSDRDLRW